MLDSNTDLTVLNGSANVTDVALNIPEILEDITCYLDRQTLTQVARVCVLWHDVSIRSLWSGLVPCSSGATIDEDIDLLYHLRRFLPSLLKPRSIFEAPPPSLFPDQTEDNWVRFEHYSSCVRALHVQARYHYPDLLFAFEGRTLELFPRLRKLSVTWESAIKYQNLAWLTLAGSELRSLRINCQYRISTDEHLQILDALCCQLPALTPRLEELCFDDLVRESQGDMVPDKVSASIDAAIRSLIYLRQFSWQSSIPIPQNIFHTLSTLPQLRRLDLWCLETPPQHTEHFFPMLHELQLCKPGSESWLKDLSNPQHLTHLTIQTHQSLPSLPTFNLVFLDLTISRPIPWVDYSPVLSCKSIETCLIVYENDGVGPGDNELGEMASSWQDLEAFSFAEKNGHSRITLLGLAHLAALCPKLKYLALGIEAAVQSEYGDLWKQEYRRVIGGSYKPGVLQELCLTMSEIQEDPAELTARGLGTLGMARLIRRLWSAAQPDVLQWKKNGEIWYKSCQTAAAVMTSMILHDSETAELRTIIQNQISEINDLRRERDSLLQQQHGVLR